MLSPPLLCRQTKDEIEKSREAREPSPWRDRPIEESLALFEQMKQGRIDEGKVGGGVWGGRGRWTRAKGCRGCRGGHVGACGCMPYFEEMKQGRVNERKVRRHSRFSSLSLSCKVHGGARMKEK